MTYCLGIKLRKGLIAIADTRITSGNETTTSKKISSHKFEDGNLFIMTSGLRSIRDKAVTYLEELIESESFQYTKMHQAVNAFGELLRKVSDEDRASLQKSGLFFNLNAIVGGQLKDDKEHKLYLIYPEGNWIEIGDATPFCIIGNSGYGTPILRRALTYDSEISFALTTGFLSFDSTRVCASDVGFPIDVVIYEKDSHSFREKRFDYHDMQAVKEEWNDILKSGLERVPNDWQKELGNQNMPLFNGTT